jgi:hypothetical protein
MAKIDKLKEKYKITNPSSITMMNRMDPTRNKKYLEWLFKMRYTKEGDKYVIKSEFPSRIAANVERYLRWREKNTQKMADDIKDINTFKGIKTFMDAMKPIAVLSREDVKKEVRVVFEDEKWKVISPLSFEASKVYGRGTKWCTTRNTYFKSYKSQGELYYIINKTTDRKYGLPICGRGYGLTHETFYNNEDDGLQYYDVVRYEGDVNGKLPWEDSLMKDIKKWSK